MRFSFVASMLLSAVVVPSALAGGLPTFSETGDGGAIADNSVTFFPLTFDVSKMEIDDVALGINGLSHGRPGDLNIFLLDPFGNSVEVMDDNGDGFAVENINLVFHDGAGATLPGDAIISSGEYLPIAGSFDIFSNGGTDSWVLVVIDDSEEGTGSFNNFTISGTIIPEPMTLSLLGIGGLALLRRKR